LYRPLDFLIILKDEKFGSRCSYFHGKSISQASKPTVTWHCNIEAGPNEPEWKRNTLTDSISTVPLLRGSFDTTLPFPRKPKGNWPPYRYSYRSVQSILYIYCYVCTIQNELLYNNNTVENLGRIQYMTLITFRIIEYLYWAQKIDSWSRLCNHIARPPRPFVSGSSRTGRPCVIICVWDNTVWCLFCVI